MARSLFGKLVNWAFAAPRARQRPGCSLELESLYGGSSRRHYRFNPRVEILEERCLLAASTFSVFLNGNQQVPIIQTAATGTGTFISDNITGLLQISFTIQGIAQANVLSLTLNRGEFAQTGPVVLDLLASGPIFTFGAGPTPGSIQYIGTNVPFPVAELPNLLSEKIYLNVITNAYPTGEVRGQLAPPRQIAAAVDAGLPSLVIVTAATTGQELTRFLAFGNYPGGVRVAVADVNGDGVRDIIVGAGPGAGPHVKVVDGRKLTQVDPNTGAILDSALLASFFAFGTDFGGGVFVAAGDVNGDGIGDIVVGADANAGPHVKVIDGTKFNQEFANGQINDTALLASFFAYGITFGGGVRVAAADINGDGFADIITGAGPGAGPHVKEIDGTKLNQVFANGQINDTALLKSYFAFSTSLGSGVYVAANFVDNDKYADVAASIGINGGSQVKVFSGFNNQPLQVFPAFGATFNTAIRVALVDRDANGLADIVVATGPGPTSEYEVLDGLTLAVIDNVFAFSLVTNGIFVGGS